VVNRHRILRRGRAYGESVTPEQAMRGESPAGDCGLLFVALQANIAHGFEFVQQIWNNNPGFHGLYQERDPIAGSGGCHFTIPAEPVRLTVQMPPRPGQERGLPRFVTPRGGGYFFMPSRTALDVLAGRLP
jgi:deferrochelatase/peroxidase EfeB